VESATLTSPSSPGWRVSGCKEQDARHHAVFAQPCGRYLSYRSSIAGLVWSRCGLALVAILGAAILAGTATAETPLGPHLTATSPAPRAVELDWQYADGPYVVLWTCSQYQVVPNLFRLWSRTSAFVLLAFGNSLNLAYANG